MSVVINPASRELSFEVKLVPEQYLVQGSGRQGCSLVGGSPIASVARDGCVAMPRPGRVTERALRGVNGLAALKTLSFSGGCNREA